MNNELPPKSELVLYQTEDGRTRVQCRFENENVWMTQALMAELFQTTPQNITLHLRAIYAEGELAEAATCKDYLQVRPEGARQVQRALRHYNLEAILAVGYRVRSPRGTAFRQWATARLKEYLVKGFTMDDERLKNPPGQGQVDYFDELLERIRDIRASERRVYLRVREILALAADYEATGPETQVFFQTIQNKLHFAATGKTAAELIAERANASQPNMGLTSWPGGVVRKGDATIAKNYLHDFLDLNERAILPDAGKVSREEAQQRAEREYERFAARRRAELEAQGEADLLRQLDAEVKKLPKRKKGGAK